MASFTTHISFGIALGVGSIIALASFALVPSGWSLYFLIALAAIVGAIMPDIDSDTGVPFHITFGSLAVVAGGLAFLYALKNTPGDYKFLIGAPLFAIFFIWVVIGAIFKKLTHHRGMAHSIPAAVLAGLIVFLFAGRSGFEAWSAFLLGVSLTLGYILHLILDEVCSVVNFHGTLFVPNKALGSALKFTSKNHLITVLVYAAIAFLLAGNGQQLIFLATKLTTALSK